MTALEDAKSQLSKALGEDLLGAEPMPTFGAVTVENLMIRVRREAWVKIGETLRDVLNCKWFDFLSAIDWMESPFGRQLDTEQDEEESFTAPPPIEWGILGGETRLQILARVRTVGKSADTQLGVILKADLPDEEPAIDSWASVYPGSDWNEREVWEMFGIRFDGHPGLRHIYLPSEFEGYPLRKDFPLLARKVKPWPGVVDVEQMPGLDNEEEENVTN